MNIQEYDRNAEYTGILKIFEIYSLKYLGIWNMLEYNAHIPTISPVIDPSTLTERRRQPYKFIELYTNFLLHIYMIYSFHYAVEITSRVGRNAHRLFVPRVRTAIAKSSFYFRGTQIWNSLDPTLYIARKLENFKVLYKTLLYV